MQIAALLADDPLGAGREDSDPAVYRAAFARMMASPGNVYMLATDGAKIIGCLQYTVIHGLSRSGASRALIDGVRVQADSRGQGVGEMLVRAAIDRAVSDGCALVQLTTDKTRARAHEFYERLGFRASHIGMKLLLESAAE